MFKKCLGILQIQENALNGTYENRIELIKVQYKKIARQHHPDKGGLTEDFQQINDAYCYLVDKKNTHLLMGISEEISSVQSLKNDSGINFEKFYTELFEELPSRFNCICNDINKKINQERSSYFAKLNQEAWELYLLNEEFYKEQWSENHLKLMNNAQNEVNFLVDMVEKNRIYFLISCLLFWTVIAIPFIVYFYYALEDFETDLNQKEKKLNALQEEDISFKNSDNDFKKDQYLQGFDSFIQNPNLTAEGKYLGDRKNIISSLIFNFEMRVQSLNSAVNGLNMATISEASNTSGFYLLKIKFTELLEALPQIISSNLKNKINFDNYEFYLRNKSSATIKYHPLTETQKNVVDLQTIADDVESDSVNTLMY
ncbi:MAG: DnaJ domain-containing protein [Nitrosopumilus sp.]|nr:DnaJ domain-containing protein [Nitrosopumilus sp.]